MKCIDPYLSRGSPCSQLNRRFWGRHFWSRGYFAATSGAITDEMIIEYIKNQDEDAEERGDDFTILDA